MNLRRDILPAHFIERQTFEIPWPPSEFSKRLVGPDSNHSALVAESEGRVVGYVVYRLASNEISIRRVAVDQAHRRRGIGTSLIMGIVEMHKSRRESISVIVDEYDLGNQLFVKRCGFKWHSTFVGKYMGIDHDKYRMLRAIAETSRKTLSPVAMGMASESRNPIQ